jgi:streptomycin 6-kinase
MTPVPAGLARTITELFAEEGQAWLQQLPQLLERCSRRWSLTLLPPFTGLSYNYVTPAVRDDGVPVVLKAGVPNPELLTEIAALRLYQGQGVVRLLDADPEWGVLLLERLQPGTLLVTVGDDAEATRIAVTLMQQMWRPLPAGHPFPTVARWAAGLERLRAHFDGGTGPFPATLVERAESLFAELLSSADEPVLLHGDLHHYNILAAGRQPWLAIDPKGVAGEPAYEVGALLRNPMPQVADWRDLKAVLARRVDLLAELLGFERQHLAGWGLAQAVLSAWWSYEDHGRPGKEALTCAAQLAAMLV